MTLETGTSKQKSTGTHSESLVFDTPEYLGRQESPQKEKEKPSPEQLQIQYEQANQILEKAKRADAQFTQERLNVLRTNLRLFQEQTPSLDLEVDAAFDRLLEEQPIKTEETAEEQPDMGEKIKNITEDSFDQLSNYLPALENLQFDETDNLTEFTVGQTKYQKIAVLGQGGYGIVSKFQKTNTGASDANPEFIALKQADCHIPAIRKAGMREARNLLYFQTKGLKNAPRIVAMLDTEGKHFIAMEFQEGKNLTAAISEMYENSRMKLVALHERLTNKEITVKQYNAAFEQEQHSNNERTFALFEQPLQFLETMHAEGYVYRDLKPDNIQSNGILLDHGTGDFFPRPLPEEYKGHIEKIPPIRSMVGTPYYLDPLILKNIFFGSETMEGKTRKNDCLFPRPRNDVASAAITLFNAFCKTNKAKELPALFAQKILPDMNCTAYVFDKTRFEKIMAGLKQIPEIPPEFYAALDPGVEPDQDAKGRLPGQQADQNSPSILELFQAMKAALIGITGLKLEKFKEKLKNLYI